ncbi:hypothetical protein Tco_0827043 [Tanacetum coccineum]
MLSFLENCLRVWTARTTVHQLRRLSRSRDIGESLDSEDSPRPLPKITSSRDHEKDSHGHEHAIGYVTLRKVYGAEARLNVWAQNVVGDDFSIPQIWVIVDVPNHGVNTVEAGWHVTPFDN